jgi:hypothetical protein
MNGKVENDVESIERVSDSFIGEFNVVGQIILPGQAGIMSS